MVESSEGKFETDEKGGKVYRIYFTDGYGKERMITACPECALPYPGAICTKCGVKICEECMAGIELQSGKVCKPCLTGE